MQHELEAETGWLDHHFAAEFPTVSMRYTVIEAANRRSSDAMRNRLADHSTKFTGRRALDLPRHQIPAAYRAFYRQLGLNPDAQPPPVEAIARERVLRGWFPSYGVVADALLVATVESHIALYVIDAAGLDGPLGIRPARDADSPHFAAGTLVIADAEKAVAELFGPPIEPYAVSRDTTTIGIYAVGVPGMDPWLLDDALWRVADMIRAG
jgi:DNA/RNA-binding domain of Phe-tRNA-synthetase-like protein